MCAEDDKKYCAKMHHQQICLLLCPQCGLKSKSKEVVKINTPIGRRAALIAIPQQ